MTVLLRFGVIGLDGPLAEPLQELALRDPALDITEFLLDLENLDLFDYASSLSSPLSSKRFYPNLGSNDSIDISGLIGLSFYKISVIECSFYNESELFLLIV